MSSLPSHIITMPLAFTVKPGNSFKHQPTKSALPCMFEMFRPSFEISLKTKKKKTLLDLSASSQVKRIKVSLKLALRFALGINDIHMYFGHFLSGSLLIRVFAYQTRPSEDSLLRKTFTICPASSSPHFSMPSIDKRP